jgi:hypothetical protein
MVLSMLSLLGACTACPCGNLRGSEKMRFGITIVLMTMLQRGSLAGSRADIRDTTACLCSLSAQENIGGQPFGP